MRHCTGEPDGLTAEMSSIKARISSHHFQKGFDWYLVCISKSARNMRERLAWYCTQYMGQFANNSVSGALMVGHCGAPIKG